jgi:hypothetical protein
MGGIGLWGAAAGRLQAANWARGASDRGNPSAGVMQLKDTGLNV